MCGRCTSVCPAHATGKPLDPREIVLKTGAVMAAHRRRRPCHRRRGDDEIKSSATGCSIASRRKRSGPAPRCKACDEICPVNIEILDKILDMRRYLTLMESDFPSELGAAFRAHGEPGQPLGHEPERAGRLGQGLRRRQDPRSGRADGRRIPLLGRVCRVVRRQEQEGHPGHGEADASAPVSTWRFSARPRCAPATRPAARATSTCSRCWRCRTSK